MGKYQMEGVEYLFKPGRKHAFFLCHCTILLGEAEELFSDSKFTGNDDFLYLLNLVVFNKELSAIKQSAESHVTSKMGSPMVCLSMRFSNKPRKLI